MRNEKGQFVKGHEVSKRWRDAVSSARKKYPSPMKGRKLGFVPKRAFKKGNVPWNKGIGKDHPNRRARKSKEALDWRTAVFKKNDYTCQHCNKKGGELNAHHILYFAVMPEARYLTENGLTLCKECHLELHKRNKPVDNFLHKALKKTQNYKWTVEQLKERV